MEYKQPEDRLGMPTMESHSNTLVFSLLSKKGGDSVRGLVRGSLSDTQLYVLFHVWTLCLHGTLGAINMILFLSLLVQLKHTKFKWQDVWGLLLPQPCSEAGCVWLEPTCSLGHCSWCSSLASEPGLGPPATLQGSGCLYWRFFCCL